MGVGEREGSFSWAHGSHVMLLNTMSTMICDVWRGKVDLSGVLDLCRSCDRHTLISILESQTETLVSRTGECRNTRRKGIFRGHIDLLFVNVGRTCEVRMLDVSNPAMAP